MAFTYFFRDLHSLDLTVKHVVPWVSGRSSIRVWDAGCAMGQEPYTLAILFAENMGKFAFKNLHIDATDIDTSNLFDDIISNGTYPFTELKRIPEELFRKYFIQHSKPNHHQIIENIRQRMRFQRHDLLTLTSPGDGYSLIVCKNVLLHFQPEERVNVIRMFHKVLAPGGYFVTEQTQKLPSAVAHLFSHVTTDAQLFKKV
ncbi:methyltransferase domain-containing protein [candidate division KSB1 bacterium]|nr:methyltransferase domain-containing protein [candidate division KSB1 bacterium]